MGLGFTLTLVLMGSIREILGSGTLFGVNLHIPMDPMIVFITPPGGFFVFGVLMGLAVLLENYTGHRIERKSSCEGCPAAGACSGEEGQA